MTLVAHHKSGDLVEGCRILSEIGQGAASVIYLAQDPKTKQIWALKHVVKGNAKDQRFLDQAELEYKTARAIRHPSVRRIERIVKKGSLLSTKELYLVMEFVDGPSLLGYKPKTPIEAVEIFRQVASGMAAMHEAGYVHADMKPHNVIVGTDIDGNLTTKLIDLGQSCKIGTVKERIQGTPDYIAPEQVHRRAITPKTDIYNLGATMYFTLTGKNIPTAMGAKADALVSSLDDNMIQKPTPPAELNPAVHPKLNDLIMQCVEINPDLRPASMQDVANTLDLVLGILKARAEQEAAGASHSANSASRAGMKSGAPINRGAGS